MPFRAAVVLLLAGLVFLPPAGNASSRIGLNRDGVVSGDVIRLGDVFHGLGENRDKVLGPAPLPGKDMVLSARTLLRIALALDLPWRPGSSADYVVLRREATVIGRAAVDEVLRREIKSKGMAGNYKILIPAEMSEIILPAGEPETAEVLSLDIKPGDRFEAVLAAPSKDNPLRRHRVAGVLQRLAGVPVLKETLRNGAVIGRHDIEMIEIPETRLQHDTVVQAENLVGTTPRRMITAGEIITAGEVESPRIVGRGDMVTIVFRSGPLLLTARGKALEHGAKGDMIRVVNSGSSRTVVAEVTASQEVTVKTF